VELEVNESQIDAIKIRKQQGDTNGHGSWERYLLAPPPVTDCYWIDQDHVIP
jgi:hypothetical protein